jgi:ribosomal protein L20A (L18A)
MGKVFKIDGSFKMGHHEQRFSKEFPAATEKEAREMCLSIFGSKHGVPRRLITIKKVAEVALDDVADGVARHKAENA